MKRKFSTIIIVFLAAFAVLSSYAATALFSKGASKLVSLFPQNKVEIEIEI